MGEAVSGRNCAGSGNFVRFRGFFEAKNDELQRDFRHLAGKFPADLTGNFAGGTGNFFKGAGNDRGTSGNDPDLVRVARTPQNSEKSPTIRFRAIHGVCVPTSLAPFWAATPSLAGRP